MGITLRQFESVKAVGHADLDLVDIEGFDTITSAVRHALESCWHESVDRPAPNDYAPYVVCNDKTGHVHATILSCASDHSLAIVTYDTGLVTRYRVNSQITEIK